MDGEVREFQGVQDLTPNSEARRWSPNRGGGAVGVVPAAVRRPRGHSPVRGARRGAGKRAVGWEGSQPLHLQPAEARRTGPALAPPLPPVTSVPTDHSTAAAAGLPAFDWPVERERRVVGA
uniref:Uncharacterized protein n=1 Tax=Rangifer tarandus platyrhynchus TaxID=3082113 RepID=A0ACB0ELH0_RANTA|nr:unnamed protein product [Rangifer tarandus platyrhynchus]